MPTLAKIIFVLGLILSFVGLLSPPIALTAGILFGLSFAHPYISESRGIARILLQSSVVALGFGMNLHEVLKAGRSGFIYTALGISFALLVGLGLHAPGVCCDRNPPTPPPPARVKGVKLNDS